MRKSSEIEAGESANKYVCANCGGPLHTVSIVTINGVPKSICKNVKCVNKSDATMEKGAVVDVEPA